MIIGLYLSENDCERSFNSNLIGFGQIITHFSFYCLKIIQKILNSSFVRSCLPANSVETFELTILKVSNIL